jgi:hypothetical protein
MRLRALGESEAIRSTGKAKAEAYRVGVESLGAQGYTVMQVMQIVGERNVRIVPDVAVTVVNDNYSSTSMTIKSHHLGRSVFHSLCCSCYRDDSSPLGGTEPLERSDKGGVEPRGLGAFIASRFFSPFLCLSAGFLR